MHMMQSAAPAHVSCCSLLGASHKPSCPHRRGIHTQSAPQTQHCIPGRRLQPAWHQSALSSGHASHCRMAPMHDSTRRSSRSHR